ncbi:MAG: tRNA dihydrouridine synthase DusB [Candidatus Omnitrophota bacterium]
MLQIGNLKLESRLILAPMAGITDLPFRLLNRRFGCELAFIEMLNVRSLSYKSRKTQEMLSSVPEDRPLGIQILGKEPKFILRALDILKPYKFDVLDFNAACPVKKVVRRGEGASLLREPKRLGTLLKLIVKNSQQPVTVKIRSGWDDTSVNAREVALRAEDAGVKALFIHGRTKAQGYSAGVDYAAIRKVREALKIPVIGSGDILSIPLVKRMFDETGCQAVAMARGALGNPWIFREAKQFLEKQEIIQRPSREEIIKVMIAHLKSYVDFHGERVGIIKFRKFFGWYVKGFRKIRPLRERSSRVKKAQEMIEIIRLTSAS